MGALDLKDSRQISIYATTRMKPKTSPSGMRMGTTGRARNPEAISQRDSAPPIGLRTISRLRDRIQELRCGTVPKRG